MTEGVPDHFPCQYLKRWSGWPLQYSTVFSSFRYLHFSSIPIAHLADHFHCFQSTTSITIKFMFICFSSLSIDTKLLHPNTFTMKNDTDLFPSLGITLCCLSQICIILFVYEFRATLCFTLNRLFSSSWLWNAIRCYQYNESWHSKNVEPQSSLLPLKVYNQPYMFAFTKAKQIWKFLNYEDFL